MNKSLFILLIAFSTASIFDEAVADIYTPDTDAQKTFKCECVMATTGCQSKLLYELSGNNIYTWYQSGYFKKGASLNLNELCYRKRDIDKLGDGLCCTHDKEEDSITKLFKGTMVE